MQESLGLFESLLNLGIFDRMNIYILLNKVDIFQRVISKVPISDYFPGYIGGADCFNACKFFADKFFSISHLRGSRKSSTSVFPITAVDSKSVLDVGLCIGDLSESFWGLYNRVTAWSWAAMDPDLSRERRTYMETFSSLGDREQERLMETTDSIDESSGEFDKPEAVIE